MLCGGGLDVEGHCAAQVVKLVEDGLVLFWGDHIVLDPSPDGHEKKHAPEGDVLAGEHLRDLADPVLVEAGHGGVDLNLEADPACDADGVHRPIEAAFDAPKLVVALAAVSVEADGEADEAGFFHPEDGFAGHLLGPGRGHRHAQADFGAVADDVEDIGPLEGVAAGDDEEDGAEPAGFIEEGEGLLDVQLPGVPAGPGLGPAVEAGERAGLGYLPDHDKGGSVEVELADSGFSRSGRGLDWPSGDRPGVWRTTHRALCHRNGIFPSNRSRRPCIS